MSIGLLTYSSLQAYLIVSFLLFTVGLSIALLRRNFLVQFMGIELMLNAANLALLAFAKWRGGDVSGTVFYFLIIAVAACEAAVGLALIIGLFRHRRSTDTDGANSLRQ
ncbi:MAG: NADH-quinone oxidoreductase subunit NuoK [Holophagales bacterium]|nr:NADH-quinone oxidoreductase subunit NuoK [Holophagales bacterium]